LNTLAKPYRDLSASPEAQADFDEFIRNLHAALTDGKRNPNDVVRDTLCQMYFGCEVENGKLPVTARVLAHTLDPRNVTTEPEYYAEIDSKLYEERKPFIWFWQMFDRSPLGQNALLGHAVRRMLAPLIFRRVGKNFKCWNHVEWSYGYNLSFGDNVVVHRHVLLDDRGGIEIGNNVSISDYANIYSHSHDINDIQKVSNTPTLVDDGARITYHATVLAGIKIGEHAMIGTGAVVTRNVEPYHIALGIPAKTVKVKSRRP
jgi:acetyltransferase-like isoleucine patch superfamily enzyme